MEGYIALHRRIIEHWIFENPQYFKCWVWFLLRANHKEATLLFGKRLVKVKRGEFITSIDKISKACNLSTRQTRTFLDLLVLDKMIVKQSNTKATKISILNYDSYQYNRQTNDTPTDTPTTGRRQAADKPATTDNNVDNVNNVNNIIYIEPENFKIENYKEQLTAVCNFFEISEQRNFNQYRLINQFLTTIHHKEQLTHFTEQFENYSRYKRESKKLVHGLNRFLGNPTALFQDGAWNAENWRKRYNDYLMFKNNQGYGSPEATIYRRKKYHD